MHRRYPLKKYGSFSISSLSVQSLFFSFNHHLHITARTSLHAITSIFTNPDVSIVHRCTFWYANLPLLLSIISVTLSFGSARMSRCLLMYCVIHLRDTIWWSSSLVVVSESLVSGIWPRGFFNLSHLSSSAYSIFFPSFSFYSTGQQSTVKHHIIISLTQMAVIRRWSRLMYSHRRCFSRMGRLETEAKAKNDLQSSLSVLFHFEFFFSFFSLVKYILTTERVPT